MVKVKWRSCKSRVKSQKSNMQLISPAGNLDKLKTAFAFGADAVYCGIPDFSLRVRINEFDLASLYEGVKYAHARGKKVYVTLNIFVHERHLVEIEKHLAALKIIGPDALVVSDPGVLQIVKKVWPEVKIHLSTQANCTNSAAARFWFEQGVSRIILAREVTLEEIKQIHVTVPAVELECFVHGAMCMSYSGRCLLSKYFSDRSANLGDCSQPCRWKYQAHSRDAKSCICIKSEKSKGAKTTDANQPEKLFEMDEDEHGSYIMNSKDLCLVEYLRELEDAGIVAGKIEGRAKSAYYVGVVTRVYRQVIEGQRARGKGQKKVEGQKGKNKKYLEELGKCQNRGFTTGFLFGKEMCEQNTDAGHAACAWEFCGVGVGTESHSVPLSATGGKHNRLIPIRVHNQIFVGDEIELVVPRGENVAMTVGKMYDEKGLAITEAHGGQGKIIWLAVDKEVPERTLIRRKL